MASQPASVKRSLEELKKLQRDLRRYSRRGGWDAKIKEELKGPANDAERAVKASIQRIPSKGQTARKGRRSLRAAMVRAVKTNVDTTRDYTGAFVYVDAYSMPVGDQNLPAYMERIRRYTRWRHEVYGIETLWVTQKAHPYFYRTLRPFESVAADVAENVIDQVKRELES